MTTWPSRIGLVLLAVTVFSGALSIVGPMEARAGDSWTYEYGEPSAENFSSANAVVVADDGSVFVMGPYFGTFEGHVAVDGFDAFLMKLSSSGEVVWVRSWDFPGGGDFSDLDAYGEPDPLWQHGKEFGKIAIDGAGNLIVSIADMTAVFDSSGELVAEAAEIDFGTPCLSTLSAVPQFVIPQMDADGGVFVMSSPSNSCVVALDASLQLEWGTASRPDHGAVGVAALDDGGVIVATNVAPEFSFQKIRQVVERFDRNGVSMWSTSHIGRCTRTHSQTRTVPVLEHGDEVSVLSQESNSADCYGPTFLASYSLLTGAWERDRRFSPETYDLWGCVPYDTNPPVIDAWSADMQDCMAEGEGGWEALLAGAYPSRIVGTSEALSILLMEDISSWWREPVVGAFEISNSGVTLVKVRRLVDDPSIEVLGVDAAPNGVAVVVGQVDGSAVTSSAVASAQPFTASDQPYARVLYNPEVSKPAWGTFRDDDTSVFEADVEWMAAAGITKGCNPPVNDTFCPDSVVTRGQMAAFLTRALGLTERLDDPFVDDDDSVFQADIEKLAAAGITKGCNPPTNDRFCPDGKVTREVMAAFLVRALGYTDSGGGDLFVDDDDSIFEGDIDRLGTAGVTKGCNPPTNDRYCPKGNVTRGQMAAFLHRALG